MVGPLLLLKMLHCRKKCDSSSSHREKSSSAERHTAKKRTDRKSGRKYPQNTCRVCLKEADIDIPIYGDQDMNDIPQALSTFGGIEIDEEDAYPKYLCRSCHALLQGAMLFRKTAQKSDQVLKKSIKCVATKVTDDFILNDNLNDSTSDFEGVIDVGEQKNYSCDSCNLEFASMKEFCDHRLTEYHENKRITCPVCNKSYSFVYYKKHRAIHEADYPYMCDICGKKFIASGSFSRHRRTHFHKLPFKCAHCPYRGRFSENLKLHMRSHTGEKPYQCSECAARFVNKSNLNKHMFTHKVERDFKCESCGKGFYTKKNLEIHIKVEHVGIKDQVCNICSKAFGTRKQMMKHQLKVHKRQKLKSGRMPLYLQIEKMGGKIET